MTTMNNLTSDPVSRSRDARAETPVTDGTEPGGVERL